MVLGGIGVLGALGKVVYLSSSKSGSSKSGSSKSGNVGLAVAVPATLLGVLYINAKRQQAVRNEAYAQARARQLEVKQGAPTIQPINT